MHTEFCAATVERSVPRPFYPSFLGNRSGLVFESIGVFKQSMVLATCHPSSSGWEEWAFFA